MPLLVIVFLIILTQNIKRSNAFQKFDLCYCTLIYVLLAFSRRRKLIQITHAQKKFTTELTVTEKICHFELLHLLLSCRTDKYVYFLAVVSRKLTNNLNDENIAQNFQTGCIGLARYITYFFPDYQTC